jgi:hypothetical protein
MASALTVGGLTVAGATSRGSEGFPDPFADMASLAMPTTIQDALRWCLVPDTPIELDGLLVKAIQDVQPGDRVLTLGGTIEQVRTVGKRAVDEEIVNLTLAGYGNKLPLRLTGNHNVWALKTGGRRPSRVKEFKLESLEKIPASEVAVGDYLIAPLPHRSSKRCAIPFPGWVVGMYLAEGCLVRDSERVMSARFTLGTDDERTGVLAMLVQELEVGTGRETEPYTPPSRSDVRVVTSHDPVLPDWLSENCPGLARTKALSSACLQWSDQTILDVLGGWLDGDGNLNLNSGVFAGASGWSTSYKLVYQLQRLASLVGLSPSLCKVHTQKGYGAHALEKSGYCLRFGKADCQVLVAHSIKLRTAREDLDDFEPKNGGARKVFIRDGHVYRRVMGVAREDYQGPVYNLEVENDHSYVARGVAVANCEFVLVKNGPYREALSRVISYFLTDVEISSPGGDVEQRVGREEKQKYLDFLNDTLGIKTVLHSIALDYLGYGNSFTSLLVPFRRYLRCPRCSLELTLGRVHASSQFHFQWADFDFHAHCPHCGYTGRWNHVDRRSGEKGDIRIKRWSPHEIEILDDPYTRDRAYIWKIPDDYRNLIRRGHLFHLERASWEIVRAIKQNKVLMFDQDVIYHMKEEPMAGLNDRGWGFSRVLTNFTQAWYVQVLQRYNEAIALDYVIPFRVITPMPRPGQGGEVNDPVLSINLGSFTSRVNNMLRMRRRDPARWNVLPFPIEYQALGGDAQNLAPKDLLELGMDMLLNAVGIPMDLYRGNLTIQAAPAALRLFEANWSHLVHNLNRFLSTLCQKISQLMSWEPVMARLQRVTHADDLNRQMAKLQLMMGGQISRTTGLNTVGLDFAEEERRKLEELRVSAEETAQTQEEMEQAAQMEDMAAPPQAGMPGMPGAMPGQPPQPGGDGAAQQMPQFQGMPGTMPGGGMPPVAPAGPMGAPTGAYGAPQMFGANMGSQPTDTPEQLEQKARVVAQQIMTLPEAQKDSYLIQLNKTDPTLHALVKSVLDDMRREAELRGRDLVMQAEYGKMARSIRL